jgi:hypothetical protein
MSWLYSQALVEEYSEGIYSDGEPSAPSRGSHTQPVFSSHDKTTVFSRRSLSGMTFKLLTEDHGEAVLTSFREDFPARTSPVREKVQGLMESDLPCGHTWRESSVKFDPDSSSWKTHLCLWEEDLPESSVTLPKWGMMLNGVCWERSMPALPTKEIESGSWPTPTSSQARSEGMIMQMRAKVDEGALSREEAELMISGSLEPARMETWATPTGNDAKNSTLPPSQIKHDNIPGDLLRRGEKPGGQLNPTWVEWLMGWPLGWTDLKPLETDKFRQWQNSHGKH